MVASRDEYDVAGKVSWKRVEELFTRTAAIMEVWVNGERISTTAEHPFYHLEQGWVPASTLTIGDQLASLHGEPAIVTNNVETDRYEPVYNLRVQDHHTYFVGCDEWGFSVWTHNACAKVYWYPKGVFDARFPHLSVETITDGGKKVHTELIPHGKNDSKVAILDGAEAMSEHQREFKLPDGEAAQAYQARALGLTGKKWDLQNNCFSHVAAVLMAGGVPFGNEKDFLRQMEEAFRFKIQDGP